MCIARFADLKMAAGFSQDTRTDQGKEVFTVCTQCKRVLVPSRKNSAPSVSVSRDEDDQWIHCEDIPKSNAALTVNLSHGLCASCFQEHMNALVDSLPPLSPPPTRHRPVPKPQPSSKQQPSPSCTRVLVVDDNKLQRQIHKRMVEQAGFPCDTASGGTQAIEMVRKHSYSLILMDLMMGDMDGWSTSRTVRRELLQTVGHQGLPRIIAVTGMQVDSEITKECVDAGMEDIIPKPVSPAILNKLLSDYTAGESSW